MWLALQCYIFYVQQMYIQIIGVGNIVEHTLFQNGHITRKLHATYRTKCFHELSCTWSRQRNCVSYILHFMYFLLYEAWINTLDIAVLWYPVSYLVYTLWWPYCRLLCVTCRLERLVDVLRRKINGVLVDEKPATSEQSPTESLVSTVSSSSTTHSPQVTMSGPVTDLWRNCNV